MTAVASSLVVVVGAIVLLLKLLALRNFGRPSRNLASVGSNFATILPCLHCGKKIRHRTMLLIKCEEMALWEKD